MGQNNSNWLVITKRPPPPLDKPETLREKQNEQTNTPGTQRYSVEENIVLDDRMMLDTVFIIISVILSRSV